MENDERVADEQMCDVTSQRVIYGSIFELTLHFLVDLR